MLLSPQQKPFLPPSRVSPYPGARPGFHALCEVDTLNFGGVTTILPGRLFFI